MSQIDKYLPFTGFRVMGAWLASFINQYITASVQEAADIAISIQSQMHIINVGSQDNVEEIVNYFASADSMTDSDDTTRDYLGSDTDVSGKVYKWGTNESYVRTADRNPAAGATIYASDGTTDTGKTVVSYTLPTSGTVTQAWAGESTATSHAISSTIMYIGGEEVTV